MTLTQQDRDRGMSLFECAKHGVLCITFDNCQVTCKCGRTASRTSILGSK